MLDLLTKTRAQGREIQMVRRKRRRTQNTTHAKRHPRAPAPTGPLVLHRSARTCFTDSKPTRWCSCCLLGGWRRAREHVKGLCGSYCMHSTCISQKIPRTGDVTWGRKFAADTRRSTRRSSIDTSSKPLSGNFLKGHMSRPTKYGWLKLIFISWTPPKTNISPRAHHEFPGEALRPEPERRVVKR